MSAKFYTKIYLGFNVRKKSEYKKGEIPIHRKCKIPRWNIKQKEIFNFLSKEFQLSYRWEFV